MEEEIKIQQYDDVIQFTLTFLFHEGKLNNDTVIFENFDENNKAHLCLFTIAKMAYNVFTIKPKIRMGIFSFQKFRKNLDKARYFERTSERGLDFSKVIEMIEKETDCPGIFKDIYEDYYEVKK